MDRAPSQQRGQPQPIFPNEMLHLKKKNTKQVIDYVHHVHIRTF